MYVFAILQNDKKKYINIEMHMIWLKIRYLSSAAIELQQSKPLTTIHCHTASAESGGFCLQQCSMGEK